MDENGASISCGFGGSMDDGDSDGHRIDTVACAADKLDCLGQGPMSPTA